MTRPEPYLSAMAPTIGCESPHNRFWMASEMENAVSPMPKVSAMGCWNKPKLWRIPMDSARTRLASRVMVIARRMVTACMDPPIQPAPERVLTALR